MDVKTAQCYSEKLQTAGLTVYDDPYLETNSHRFRDDMKIWPQIEYRHIFVYFANRLSTFTQQQLLALKQVEEFKYFQSGFQCCMEVEEEVA